MNDHKIFHDLTMYDVFIGIVGNKTISADRLREILWLRDDANLDECLQQLLDENLIIKIDNDYQPSNTDKARILSQFINFAIAVELDYNFYLSDLVRRLIKNSYGHHYFDQKKTGITDDHVFYRLIRRICMDSLLVLHSLAPFSGKLIPNMFIDLLCDYWDIKPQKPGFFERKRKIDIIIENGFLQKDGINRTRLIDSQGLYYSEEDTEADLHPRLTKLQTLIKHDIIPKNPDIFDAIQSVNNKKAMAYQDHLIDVRRQLTLPIIAAYHSLSFFGYDNPAPYRDFEVVISANPHFKATKAAHIKGAMREFHDHYRDISLKTRALIPSLELAAYVFCEIIHIQPYADGNSRTALLSLLHVLRLLNTGIERLPQTFAYQLIQITKGAPKRDDSTVIDLLKDLCLLRCNQNDLREIFRCR